MLRNLPEIASSQVSEPVLVVPFLAAVLRQCELPCAAARDQALSASEIGVPENLVLGDVRGNVY